MKFCKLYIPYIPAIDKQELEVEGEIVNGCAKFTYKDINYLIPLAKVEWMIEVRESTNETKQKATIEVPSKPRPKRTAKRTKAD